MTRTERYSRDAVARLVYLESSQALVDMAVEDDELVLEIDNRAAEAEGDDRVLGMSTEELTADDS